MNFSKIFINDNLIDIIYNKLDLNDKVNFSSINNYSFNNYKGINKSRIYLYVNNDIILFKKALERFNYSQNELLKISEIAINNIPNVKEKKSGSYQTNGINNIYNCYYDLRYIYELILYELHINNIEFNNIVDNHSNDIIKFLINTIKKNISFTRTETAWKINSEPCLRTLHYDFKPLKI